MVIELNLPEQLLASNVSTMVTLKRGQGTKHTNHSARGDLQIWTEGFGGEIAVCRALNLYPDINIYEKKDLPTGDARLRDGRSLDVKTTTNNNGPLIVRPYTKPRASDLYILVICIWPRYRLAGWASRDECFNAPLTDFGKGL